MSPASGCSGTCTRWRAPRASPPVSTRPPCPTSTGPARRSPPGTSRADHVATWTGCARRSPPTGWTRTSSSCSPTPRPPAGCSSSVRCRVRPSSGRPSPPARSARGSPSRWGEASAGVGGLGEAGALVALVLDLHQAVLLGAGLLDRQALGADDHRGPLRVGDHGLVPLRRGLGTGGLRVDGEGQDPGLLVVGAGGVPDEVAQPVADVGLALPARPLEAVRVAADD